MFFRINGDSVQQLGIRPDVVLPSLTEPLEIGEMFSSNHLPWDSIEPQSYRIYDPRMDSLLPQVRRNSAKRIASDPDYQKLEKKIKRLTEQLDAKKVSLNEEKRWKEYLADRHLSLDEEDPEEPVEFRRRSRRRKQADPVLREAERIAADYYQLTHPSLSVRKEKDHGRTSGGGPR